MVRRERMVAEALKLTDASYPEDVSLRRAFFASDARTEVDAHFQVAAFSVAAALVAALLIVLTIGYAGALRTGTAFFWLAYMMAAGGVHIATSIVYRRIRGAPTVRAWAWGTAVITFAEGLGWGFAPFAIAKPGAIEALFLVMLTTLCVSAGSVIGSGRFLPTRAIAFVTPTTPYLVYSALSDDRIVRGSFFLILVFLLAIGRLGLTADLGFRREAAMRRKNELLASDLLQQKEAAERANLAKSNFLAAASHDLRQPIHALGLYSGTLRNASLSPELRSIADKIEASIEVMDRLFAAILDISRLDAGAVEVRIETFALDELTAQVCEQFYEACARKSLKLSCATDGFHVKADRVLLERILRNLVANAVRYTDCGEIHVRSRRRGEKVALQVWDTGRGVARAHLARIFEEYFQIDNPERDREKGLGLGLAIVRRLANLSGATVKAKSRVGRGSCFEVRLNLGAASEAARSVAAHESSPGPRSGLVVVVDDEAAVRDAMRAALAGWGYSVVVAESCAEALDAIEARAHRPALLVCDYRLRAGEDGLACIAAFRHRFGESFPAVLMTGDTAPERIAQAQESGVHLLHKPVAYGKLRAAVGNLVDLRLDADEPVVGLGLPS